MFIVVTASGMELASFRKREAAESYAEDFLVYRGIKGLVKEKEDAGKNHFEGGVDNPSIGSSS